MSLGSLGCVLGVVRFIRGRWVISVWTWVHPGSLWSLRFTLGIVRFIRVRWVHSGLPRWSLGSFEVVGLSRVRRGVRWVHPESVG